MPETREIGVPEPPAAWERLGFAVDGDGSSRRMRTGRWGEPPPALWGLVVVVDDLDALGDLVGTPRDAVQPGRRIATVRREAGLETALAFMTPRGRSHDPPT